MIQQKDSKEDTAIKFYDTNALLLLQEDAFKEFFLISDITLREIENIKTSGRKDEDVKFKARNVARLLDNNIGSYEVVNFEDKHIQFLNQRNLDTDSPDMKIVCCAYFSMFFDENIIFVSDDLNCKNIARSIFHIPVQGVTSHEETYLGFKEVSMTDEEMAYFYEHITENKYDLLVNEYLIIKNTSQEIVDYRRWDGTTHDALGYKQIWNDFVGNVKPRNPQQVLAFDVLQNPDITIKVLSGPYGSGKDYIMISNALELIRQGKYERLVWVRNTVEVANSKPIGFLPGDMNDKLKPYSLILADHLGGEQGLELYMMHDKIELQHLGFIRGRDYKNCILYCSESENMTKEHVQLLMGRVGEGSSLWLNGDYKQTDSPVFKANNGLTTIVSKLKGHEKFGYVKLLKTERSETAAMADLLD